MLPLAAGLLTAAGLVYLVATRPSWKETLDERRLRQIASRGKKITLDEAEDGAVLARRLGYTQTEQKLRTAAARLRKKR